MKTTRAIIGRSRQTILERPKTATGARRAVSACNLRHGRADAVEGRLSPFSAMVGRYSRSPPLIPTPIGRNPAFPQRPHVET